MLNQTATNVCLKVILLSEKVQTNLNLTKLALSDLYDHKLVQLEN